MITQPRLERTLPTILDELAAGPTPDYLDDVFTRTAPMRQRPGWTFPERWLPMADITRSRAFAPAPPWRLLAVALVVLALVATALVFVGTQQPRVPAPFGPAKNGLVPYDKAGDIYVADPATGESRLVLGGPEVDSNPSYSPDGTLIAFLRDAPNLMTEIYVVRPDGTDLRLVTKDPLDELDSAFWAPDSRRLGVGAAIGDKNHFWLMDANGVDKPVELAAGYQPDNVAFRPPDGKEIMFRGTTNEHLGMYVMDVDTGTIRTQVAPDLGTDMGQHLNFLTYTADGSQILYQHAVSDGCCELWVMNADGTGQHRFDPLAGPGQAGVPDTSWGGQAVVSPDGTRVAYWHVFNDRPTQRISVARMDGTGEVVQTGPELNGVARWVWSPDSTKLLMSPLEDVDEAGHYLLDPAGGPWKAAPWQGTGEPDWQRLAP